MFMVSLDLSFEKAHKEKEGLFAFSASVIFCVRGKKLISLPL